LSWPFFRFCAYRFHAEIMKSIINDIADQADDFLEDVTDRAQARAAISEQITIKYPGLPGTERGKVIEGVLAVLDEEGFLN
jgi:hypothetical protein